MSSLRQQRSNWLVAVLLLFACFHCTWSIFFDNVSWIDLHKYALGQERMPFQGRVGMMLPLRIAARSSALNKLAEKIDRQEKHQLGRRAEGAAEPMSAEKLTSMLIALVSNVLALVVLSYFGFKRTRRVWWLPGVVFLAIMYASYAARYEEAYWYPYDLPHMLLFGTASVLLLEGLSWAILPLFIVDTFMRETSIYLALLALPFFLRRYGWKHATGVAVSMLGCWLLVRIPISHHFASNVSETGSRLSLNFHNLLLPTHWPQMASAFGFLYVPVWIGRSHLSSAGRRLLWASVPCIITTCIFGIWIESRIFLEWTMPISLLAAIELLALFDGSPESYTQPARVS